MLTSLPDETGVPDQGIDHLGDPINTADALDYAWPAVQPLGTAVMLSARISDSPQVTKQRAYVNKASR